MNGEQGLQLDLFGDVEQGEAERLGQALVCLRDAVPQALEVVVHLRYWKAREVRRIGSAGEWAYSLRPTGLRYEPVSSWWPGGGWARTPDRVVGWDELDQMLAADARRAAVVRWAQGLTSADRWRDLYRPFELWPEPQQWHPSRVEADHRRPGWDDRIHAWRTVQTILTSAAQARGWAL